MQILCPFCSRDSAVRISCEEEDVFAMCPECGKRFRLRTFRAEEIVSEKQEGRYRYTCKSEEGLDRFYSSAPLSLREGDLLTTVRRGREVLGIADQDRDRWYPVKPPRSSYPLLRALGLSLAWPVSLLALLQAVRALGGVAGSALESPLGFVAALAIVSLLFLSPLLLWLIRTLFPYGPGRERIKGYDPRL